MRGPKPLPTAIKRARNTYRRDRDRRHNVPEPPPLPGHVPSELNGDTKATAEWHRVMAIRPTVATEADRSALIALCLEWSLHLQARRNAQREKYRSPNGSRSVWFAVARHTLTACMKLWAEFGLTPSARARVPIAPAPVSDAFEEFDTDPEPTRPN